MLCNILVHTYKHTYRYIHEGVKLGKKTSIWMIFYHHTFYRKITLNFPKIYHKSLGKFPLPHLSHLITPHVIHPHPHPTTPLNTPWTSNLIFLKAQKLLKSIFLPTVLYNTTVTTSHAYIIWIHKLTYCMWIFMYIFEYNM